MPIVSQVQRGERVLVYDRKENEVNAMRAVHLTNTSDMVLANGSISILEGSRFVGQVQFDPMLPGDDQLIRYGQDSSMSIVTESVPELCSASTVRLELVQREENGVLLTTQVREWRCALKATQYTVRNNSVERVPRVLYLDHSASNTNGGYEILHEQADSNEGGVSDLAPAPIKTAQGFARYRLVVGSQEEQHVTVRERAVYSRALSSADLATFAKSSAVAQLVAAGNVTAEQVATITAMAERSDLAALLHDLKTDSMSTKALAEWPTRQRPTSEVLAAYWTKLAMGPLATASAALAAARVRRAACQEETKANHAAITTIEQDQARLRENLRSLEKVSGKKLVDRYLLDFDHAEDALRNARERLRVVAEEERNLVECIAQERESVVKLAHDAKTGLPAV